LRSAEGDWPEIKAPSLRALKTREPIGLLLPRAVDCRQGPRTMKDFLSDEQLSRPSPNWRGPLNGHCPKTYLLGTSRYEGAVADKKMSINIHPNILKDELRRLRWSRVINQYVQF